MAVSVGTTPERWLQGLDRLVAAAVDLLPDTSALLARRERLPARWVLERGPVRAAAPVDALGGYPGSLRTAHRFERTDVIATERYLVIGEGSTAGFALPMSDIVAAGVVRPSLQANPGLVIHYQDGAGMGMFALNFRGLVRNLSGGLRAEDVMRVLAAHGVQRLQPGRIPRFPRLTLEWDDARRYANEPLAWAGSARGAVGGWFGALQRPCRVLLTEESLFWCCSEGSGVNRLLLADVVEARDGVADRVQVKFHGPLGYQYEIPFDFDTGTPGAAPQQQRMYFLNHLAASGVAVSTAPVPLAPWRRGGTVRPTDRGR